MLIPYICAVKISTKKIPIPERGRKGHTNAKYPLHLLKTDEKPLELEYDRIVHQTLYGCIENYRRHHDKTAKFVIRTSKPENYIRVWRVK